MEPQQGTPSCPVPLSGNQAHLQVGLQTFPGATSCRPPQPLGVYGDAASGTLRLFHLGLLHVLW